MAEQSTQEDFYATFYGSESGRRVFQWMHLWIEEHVELSAETAMAQCILRDLLKDIKTASGLTDPMELIRLEAQAAAITEPTKKPETTNLLGD
jgi:predicted ABC-type ATPase